MFIALVFGNRHGLSSESRLLVVQADVLTSKLQLIEGIQFKLHNELRNVYMCILITYERPKQGRVSEGRPPSISIWLA